MASCGGRFGVCYACRASVLPAVSEIARRSRKCVPMPLTIETEEETDGRWLAEVPELPGVLAYGQTRAEAVSRAEVLALRVLADRIEAGEAVPQAGGVFAVSP